MPIQVSYIFPPVNSRGEKICFQIVFSALDSQTVEQRLFTLEEFETLAKDVQSVLDRYRLVRDTPSP